MSPEEHLRRMRDDEVWTLEAPKRTPARADRWTVSRGRQQTWTTVVVAVAVVVVAGLAIGVAPSRGGGPAGPGVAQTSESPTASATPSEQPPTPAPPSATPVPSASDRSAVPEPGRLQSSPIPEDSGQSASPRAAAALGDRPALAFVAADRADLARGERAIDCLHAKGVEFVDLAAPDAEGVRYLEFGGARNDQRSISLGLQFADACIAAAAR